jgi:hypothetical protein
MLSHTTARFREAFAKLPTEVQRSAKRAFALWQNNPFHKSLRFKQIHPVQPIYSVRVGLYYRAIGIKENDTMIWFWIGTHADYDGMI